MSSSLIWGKYLVCQVGESAESSVVIHDGAIFQKDGVIQQVGPFEVLKSQCEPEAIIGGHNYLVIPGLINAHHHGRGLTTFQMGTCDDSLEMWILRAWGRRPYDQYLMTLYTNMQMIESGTTTVMYNHPQSSVPGLENDIAEIMRAFNDSGMRVAFSVYFRDQNRLVYGDDGQFLANLPSDLADKLRHFLAASDLSADDYFTLFESTYNKFGADPAGKVRVLLSPSNVQWNSDEFLQRAKEYATRYQTGLHMHLAESLYQKEYGIRSWGKTPVAHLADLGFLGPELSCAHAVWLTEEDADLLAQSHTTVCHNASSNLRLRNGIAPVNSMVKKGINVALGTDSTAINDDDDMLQEMRLAARLHQQPGIDSPAINSHQVLRMATLNAAQSTFFHNQIGSLESGRRADVVLMDLTAMEAPYMDPDISVIETLLYRGKVQHVDTVIIDGEVVLQGGKFTRFNKEDVAKELHERYAHLDYPEVAKTRLMVHRLLPHVKDFYRDWQPKVGRPHYQYNSRT